MDSGHKSGFVAIIGKPNAGKSTLLNVFLGQKLAITTAKAQTTRHRILGILDEDDYQIVFSDTPGVIKPKYGLQRAMMKFVDRALEDADLIVLLIDVNEKFPEDEMIKTVGDSMIDVILVLNKIDAADESKAGAREKEILEKIEVVDSIQISALNKKNTDELLGLIIKHLPEGPPYFDKGSLSDRPERFFVSEIIREKLFEKLEEELPYSCEVEVVSFEEEEKIIRISADIHVERRTHKGMIIGKGGKMIKAVGTDARKDIEEFLQNKVHLELYVRVSEGWKDDSRRLKGFGYD